MNLNPLSLALALYLPLSAAGMEYSIQIHRPATAGQQYRFTCQADLTVKTTAGAGGRTIPQQMEDYSAELESLVKVLETDPQGRVKKLSCVVSKCVAGQGRKPKAELLTPETVIVASLEGKRPKFEVNGREPEDNVKKALTLLLELDAAGPTADEVFGIDQPQKIGASWDVSTEHISSLLGTQEMGLGAGDVQGRTTLERVVKVGAIECLELSSRVYLKELRPQLPPGLKVKQAFGVMRYSGKFPVDTSIGPLQEVFELSIDFAAEGAPAGNLPVASVRNSTVVKRTASRTYVK